MRNLAALLCFVTLVLGANGGDRLLASSAVLRPAGAAETAASTSAAQVISVGEQVTGLVGAVPELAFEVTAPSDGTLVIELTGDVYLQFEDVYLLPMWRSPSVRFTAGALQVAAGQTYLIWVGTLFGPWDSYGDSPFVLTTSLASGPVTLPAGCEIPPPGGDWICVGGGWVPADHPLAITDSPSSFPNEPPTAPPPPFLPGPVGCSGVQPAATWLCVNAGWVPPDHPLAQSAPANSTQPAPPSAPPPECTTPDPFRGIPGLVGVCLGGGWVPVGHPLAR